MEAFQLIKTFPEKENYKLFSGLVTQLYASDSERFVLGNDPARPFLEGCYVLIQAGKPVGRFAFYENPALQYKQFKTACFGSYECVADTAITQVLHQHIEAIARKRGYAYLIGPMEGSTWQNYRFSDHNQYSNFFMEPFHHAYYNEQLKENGFGTIASYFSNLDERLNYDSEKLDKFEAYYKAKGAKFRFLNLDNLEEDLLKIATFSNESFAQNFLYTPIDPQDFVSKYLKLKDLFDPQLVWIVEDTKGDMQAFIFAIKDYRDTTGKTSIIKSMVRKADSDFRGIGSYLAGKIIQLSAKIGYTRMIHALMIRDNASVKVSERYAGKAFKSYSLYGKQL